ncbi:MAG TPA: lysophospholipid acyltransferase family protein [Anaeromyxobacteraceae bacterium]
MIARLVGWLPRSWVYAAGAALAWVAWALRVRRRVVLANLRTAFPEKGEAERLDIARRTYRNLGRMAAEFLVVPRMAPAELERALTFEGLEIIQEARARGQGVVVCTAHFGNWELLQAGTALLGLPISSISRHQARTGADALVKRTRAGAGVEELEVRKGETLKAALRALRQGRILGYVIDQNMPRRRAVFPTFFGVPAATSPTPAYLAMRHGARVVFAVAVPDGEGRYRAIIEGPFEPRRSGDREADVLAFMQELNDRLERRVRAYPDRWYWLHRRWKTRPED